MCACFVCMCIHACMHEVKQYLYMCESGTLLKAFEGYNEQGLFHEGSGDAFTTFLPSPPPPPLLGNSFPQAIFSTNI